MYLDTHTVKNDDILVLSSHRRHYFLASSLALPHKGGVRLHVPLEPALVQWARQGPTLDPPRAVGTRNMVRSSHRNNSAGTYSSAHAEPPALRTQACVCVCVCACVRALVVRLGNDLRRYPDVGMACLQTRLTPRHSLHTAFLVKGSGVVPPISSLFKAASKELSVPSLLNSPQDASCNPLPLPSAQFAPSPAPVHLPSFVAERRA